MESTSRGKGLRPAPTGATAGARAAGLRAVVSAQEEVAAAISRNSALIAALHRVADIP